MEKNLNKVLDEVLTRPGVTGALCADKNGLCLAAKGTANPATAGPFAQIANQALLLEPSKVPVVRLETDSKEVLLQNTNGITLAIFRNLKK